MEILQLLVPLLIMLADDTWNVYNFIFTKAVLATTWWTFFPTKLPAICGLLMITFYEVTVKLPYGTKILHGI